ncbi:MULTISPECIES: glycosyltransferase [Acidithrix]|uniref:GDP-mannose-dependent alpha-(1-6)-phosphatidylinositol monomannoside mannosyltransferase n=1 Tax=Acidithrix ferrooxidans TaxID=1280514 RepID=A0A0D8HLI9_9ACTN|nr:MULTISPECIES: glycosyltransferase [Acidithrix]KJF18739.1 GDP-mannose-dependent alpha-(1-6)-phosphatidylinositol monomannoside mannosyltransferase [Acidithrix ferrooxidans]
MAGIHQFIPVLSRGDGTSNNALAITRRIREVGIDSRIYLVENFSGEEGYFYSDYLKVMDPQDILIYHLATSSPIPIFLDSLPNRVVVLYQNLTPASYFAPYDLLGAVGQEQARAELSLLARRSTMGIAPSRFNGNDMIECGYANVEQVPIIFDTSDFMGERDPAVERMLWDINQRGFSNWLFVGRIVPNKAQEHLIMALGAHREIYGDNAMLHIVGRPTYPAYLDSLYRLAVELGLDKRVNFVLGVSPKELASFYAMADLFISASEHEGFGMPLVEAMFHGLPVLAYGKAAVPETVGKGGIVLDTRDPIVVASWAHEITNSYSLSSAMAELGRSRLMELAPSETVAILDKVLEKLLSECGLDGLGDFSRPSSLIADKGSNGILGSQPLVNSSRD